MSESDRPSRPSGSQGGRGRHARPDDRTPRRIREAPGETSATPATPGTPGTPRLPRSSRRGTPRRAGDRTGDRAAVPASVGAAASSPADRPRRARRRAAGTAKRSSGPHDHRQLGSTPVKVVLSVLAVILLVGGGYAYSAVGRLSGNLATTGGLDLGNQADGATDILLVGIDSRTDAKGNPLSQDEIDMLRAGEEETTSTDTMILIRIPNDGSSATAVSLPRDTYVNGGEELGNVKLNSVYGSTKFYREQELTEKAAAAGETPDEARISSEAVQAGREALVSSIANLTGISVDHYAEVGLLGFVLLTDAVGGVDVCLNNPVDEPLSGAKFPAGRQTLDGRDALSFVRQRHDLPRGDLDRITRQQAYLASLANKILSARTLSDPGQLGKLNDAVSRSVTIDSGWDIMGLATQMQNLSGGNVTFQTIPVTSIDGTGDYGESVVTVNPDQVHAFFRTLLGDDGSGATETSAAPEEEIPDYDPAESTVSVLNAGNVDGLATRVGDLVAGAGFTVGEVGNHTETGVSESQVNVADASDPAARDLARKLGGLEVVEDASLAPGQISVTLSGTYDGPGDTADDTRTLSGSDGPGTTGTTGGTTSSEDAVGTPGTTDGTTDRQAPISAGTDGPMCVN
ncbi:Transcriptional regulator LytR [Corynebacterium provencense]|uniref:Transcriptional regulator LytR n=1 Tax=Corynebacterium provencense TaxID=1737425 RepID=A0A2Z3YW00_9CORY|nr:LCP family protein [Corynebacterium provencense]AWT25583.1 Transcriptional regulator LytR [Corynebacterium provencense]MCI1256387.1 LCP family protein [Corynebacterium provencense]